MVAPAFVAADVAHQLEFEKRVAEWMEPVAGYVVAVADLGVRIDWSATGQMGVPHLAVLG